MRSHNVAVRKWTGPYAYGLGESNAPPFMKPRGQATWALCAAPLPNHAGPRGLGAVRRSAAKPRGPEGPGRWAPLRCQTTRGREAWACWAPLRCLTTKGAPAPASEAAPPSAVAPISVAPSRGLLNGELGGAAGEPSSAPASGAPAGAAASNSLASMNGRAEPRDAARDAAWELARESPVFGRTGGVREAWADRKGDGDPDAYESAGCTMVAAWS